MVTTLKIEIMCDYDSRDKTYYKDMFEVISINKTYFVEQHYSYGTDEDKKEETYSEYTIKQKQILIQIIKSKISYETYAINFGISQGKPDIVTEVLFDKDIKNEKKINKTIEDFFDIIDKHQN